MSFSPTLREWDSLARGGTTFSHPRVRLAARHCSHRDDPDARADAFASGAARRRALGAAAVDRWPRGVRVHLLGRLLARTRAGAWGDAGCPLAARPQDAAALGRGVARRDRGELVVVSAPARVSLGL